MTEETGLIVLEKINPKEVLTTGKGLDAVLAAIRERAFSMGQDVETKIGREIMRTTAHNIAKSKTFLVGCGDKLKRPNQDEINKVNGNLNKKAVPVLDALKKEYRQPLTDYEDAEEKRVAAEKAAEDAAFQKKVDDRMNLLAGYNNPIPYQEVATMKDELWDETIAAIKDEWECEQARLATEKRLEDEKQTKIAAEQKIEADRLEKERLEFEEKQRVDQIERDRIFAEQQAALDKTNAEIEAKQAKIDAKEAELKAEEDRVEADRLAAEEAEKEKERVQQAEVDRVSREAEEAIIAEAMRPDKEKLTAWVTFFDTEKNNPTPDLKTDEAKEALESIIEELNEMLTTAYVIIEEL
jgi:hypothetical protein